MTNLELAKSQAKINQKPILLAFTGSDWCGWCVKLEQEVLSQPAFQTWAQEHVITLVADFPRHTPLPADLAAQNEALAQQYGISGFPTVLLLDADGHEIARTGYQPGGAQAYVNHLKSFLS